MSEDLEKQLLDLCAYLPITEKDTNFDIKQGITGDIPSHDIIRLDKESCQFSIRWNDNLPSTWTLYRNDLDIELKLLKITSLYLEPVPSFSFRIYMEDNTLLKLTPYPATRNHTILWADAILAILQLQNLELTKTINNENLLFYNLYTKYYELNPLEHPLYIPSSNNNEDIEEDKGSLVYPNIQNNNDINDIHFEDLYNPSISSNSNNSGCILS